MVFKQFTWGLLLSVMILIIEFTCPPPSSFFLQVLLTTASAYFITIYYEVRWSVITKCDKCYFKVRQALQSEKILLQSATERTYGSQVWGFDQDGKFEKDPTEIVQTNFIGYWELTDFEAQMRADRK